MKRILDVYSGAGGCARGYMDSGFECVGVDNRPQPRYVGAAFILGDALDVLGRMIAGVAVADVTGREWRLSDFDAIHASPPCQHYCALKAMWNRREHPDLISPTRAMLRATGKPYVIENVHGAPLRAAIMLCGSMFRLGTGDAELRRHRWFECHGFEVGMVTPCEHGWRGRTVAVYGHAGGKSLRQRSRVIGVYGGHGRDRRRRENCQGFPTSARREAMGIDWMTGEELSQAIPPAYTKWLGEHLQEASQCTP